MKINKTRCLIVVTSGLLSWAAVLWSLGLCMTTGPYRGVWIQNCRCTLAGACWNDFTNRYEFSIYRPRFGPDVERYPWPWYWTADYCPGYGPSRAGRGWTFGAPQ
jgi:hypothetical protein